jgi:predicted metal-dependent hydrolase
METSVIVSIITGIVTIITVIINAKISNREIQHKLETQQAVFETKLDSLSSEVREHNNFARRMPVVEEQIKDVTRRLEVCEREVQRQSS